jgi:hypothetical protein
MAWKWYYDVDPAYKHPTDAPAAFAPIPRTIKTEFGYCGKI